MKYGKHEIIISNNKVLNIQPLTNNIIRISLSEEGKFKDSGLLRYGIIKNDWKEIGYEVHIDNNVTTIKTPTSALKFDGTSGKISIYNAFGMSLIECTPLLRTTQFCGFGCEFSVSKDEKFYGLGDDRDRIEKRGLRKKMWISDPSVDNKNFAYGPMPFLMSTKGWGIFANTTWKHFWDICCENDSIVKFWGNSGDLDFYLFTGSSVPELIDRYTEIVGKPTVLPTWAYGLMHICFQYYGAREVLEVGRMFRKEGIPCDSIGLEPGWMENYYDFSINKQWNKERFYTPHWQKPEEVGGDTCFGNIVRRNGFNLSLWLCCDYDVTYEEERELSIQNIETSEFESTGERVVGNLNTFLPLFEFADGSPNVSGQICIDKITNPSVPWYDHLKKFVRQGATAFKLDPANYVYDHPDRKWGNGMDDEEAHNLYPVILQKQMNKGFHEQTGLRSMSFTCGAYSGIQKYGATWCGDTGGGHDAAIAMINLGMCGNSNVTCDMEVFSPEGIHFGLLQPWSQVSSWFYWGEPWYLGEKLEAVFKFYAKLRYKLLPYIYSMAHIANKTGMPIIRGMSLANPEIKNADNLNRQYMFGESLLAGVFTDTVYLPEGEWIDYWSGTTYEGGSELKCNLPDGKGGPLFIKKGAIIPYWPEISYVGQKEITEIFWDIYPDDYSSFTLYEDDGLTNDYLDNHMATTKVSCCSSISDTIIEIHPRQGSYKGMPSKRIHNISVFADKAPGTVTINSLILEKTDWSYDVAKGCIHFTVTEDKMRTDVKTIRIS